MRFALLFAVVLFLNAVFIYTLAYRNIDVALNMCMLENQLHISLTDVDFSGREYNFKDLYVLGLKQYFIAFLLFICGALILIWEVLRK